MADVNLQAGVRLNTGNFIPESALQIKLQKLMIAGLNTHYEWNYTRRLKC
jgi:hypothetical protein